MCWRRQGKADLMTRILKMSCLQCRHRKRKSKLPIIARLTEPETDTTTLSLEKDILNTRHLSLIESPIICTAKLLLINKFVGLKPNVNILTFAVIR